jgi:hypothetical protein
MPPLEDAERRRIRQHDAGGPRTDGLAQRVEIDVAARERRNLAHRAAAHRRGRRVRAVRGVWNDDLGAREVAARAVIGADHRDPCELALRARHRRQRDTAHARDVLQHFLELVQALEHALPGRLGRKRVPTEQLRQHRILVAGPRVVFHRARAERVEVRVDREVELREPREMTHGLQLGHSGSGGGVARRRCSGIDAANSAVGNWAAAVRPGIECSKISFSCICSPQAAVAFCSTSASAAAYRSISPAVRVSVAQTSSDGPSAGYRLVRS